MTAVFIPLFDFVSGLLQGFEPVLVQAFIPKFSIHTSHKGILRWLPWPISY